MIQRSPAGTEVLIKWKHLAAEVSQRYPEFLLADQVAALGGGDDRFSYVYCREHRRMGLLPDGPRLAQTNWPILVRGSPDAAQGWRPKGED